MGHRNGGRNTVVMSLLIAALVVPASATSAQAPVARVDYGGSVVISSALEPPTLNPFMPGGDNSIVHLIGEGYFAQTFKVDAVTGEYLPEVVSRVPTVANGDVAVNGDGTMTVTYRIHDDAVWSDGVPITGEDYRFTLDTILRTDLPVSKATYEDIISTDERPGTFSATFDAPSARYLDLFDVVLPHHAVEGTDFLNDWNTAMWPSGGPFAFAEWQFGDFIRLERNPNYWGTDRRTGAALPYLDEVVFRFIPDALAEVNGFRARETDVFQPSPDVATLGQLAALERDGADLNVFGGPIWEHLNFQFGPNNRNTDSLNEHLAFRQAIAHAVDRRLFLDEILAGYGAVSQSIFEAYNPAFTQRPWTEYDYDPVLAAQLLDQACTDAERDCDADPPTVIFSTTSNNTARVMIAEILLDPLETIGIDYRVELEDSQLYFGDTLIDGTWDLGEWAWLGGALPDAAAAFLEFVDPDQPAPDGENYYRWGSADSSVITENSRRVGEIRDLLQTEADVDVVTALLQEAEQAIADDMVFLPLYRRLVATAVWADTIAGVESGPYDPNFTWNIGGWRRLDIDPVPAGRCDFNGDGIDDLAIASPGETVNGEAGAGMVQVAMGRPVRGVVGRPDQVWTQDTPGIVNVAEAGDAFGSDLACADFDGDGFSDLAIGVPGEGIGGVPNAGGVAIIHGSRFGLKANRDEFWHREQPSVRGSAMADDRFGTALAAGDFNGDGFDDLAVGVPGARFSGHDGAGVTHVFYATEGGLTASGSGGVIGDHLLNGTFGEDAAYGSALAAGDLNGDGIDDLVIGASGAASRIDLDLANVGGVEFVPGTLRSLDHGGSSSWTQDSPGILNVGEQNDRFGAALAIGDFNGDARLDVAIGAPGESIGGVFKTGLVHVLYSDTDGPATAGNETLSELVQPKAGFGSSLAAGQLDGRRGDDLVIGVAGWDAPAAKNAGAVFVAFSGPNTVVGWGTATLSQPERRDKQDRYGAAVRVVDVNDDGYADLLAGAPGERVAGSPSAGRVDAHLGVDSGLSPASIRWRQGAGSFSGAPDESDHFGGAIGG